MKIDALSSAVILAFITAIFAYWRYTREQQHHRNTLLNALFGELANIYEHYTYAAFELPCNVENNNELKKRLSWSLYGELRSTKDVTRFGFLNALDINALLQLELSIRNNDMLIKQYINDIPSITVEQLEYMRKRLHARTNESYQILEKIFIRNPELEKVFNEIKKGLP